MTQPSTLPESATHALALAHIADLRREAELGQLARTVRRSRRQARGTPAWPAVVVAALRDSLAGSRTGRTPVPAADRSGTACCA